ncbi:hypothetical protein R3F64_13315 [Halomonas sp. 5021]|uniref:hypothetical protein n=1 Tax=Halomonas sp. 5021 TaxID=3082156 RepID=UPI002FC5DFDB
MDKEVKKVSYKWLAIGVGVTALIAVVAYIWNFWSWPPSQKPADWADFATYISGTVGVAAVVATLIAFVITLRQQNRLINSQGEMIDKQEEQLDVSKNQLALSRQKEKLEMVYRNSFQVLPIMVDALCAKSEKSFPYYVSFDKDKGGECVVFFQNLAYLGAARSIHNLGQALIGEEVTAKDVMLFVDDFYSEVKEIFEFSFKQVAESDDLYYVVDGFLKREVQVGVDAWFYFKCYYAYRSGLNDFEFCEKAKKYLKLNDNFSGYVHNWHVLGRNVAMKISE